MPKVKIEMSEEFVNFLKEEKMFTMFSILPKEMQKDIYKTFNELKEGEK